MGDAEIAIDRCRERPATAADSAVTVEGSRVRQNAGLHTKNVEFRSARVLANAATTLNFQASSRRRAEGIRDMLDKLCLSNVLL